MPHGMITQRRDLATTRTIGKRVLVVDAHPLVRWALVHMLNESEDLVPAGESTNATDALSAVFALVPDVVVIDCSLPEDTGWALARSIKERYSDTGIVIMSVSESDDHLLRALDIGASAFLSKTASVQDIMAAIRHAAVSASSFSAAGLAQALRRRSERSSVRPMLSDREYEVLRLLRDGYSVPEVAKTLYVSLSTAKTYVARVYQKLGANNRAQALMRAIERGVFDEQHPIAV